MEYIIDENLKKDLLNDFLPVFRKFAGSEVYSITLCGSHGKGLADNKSDFDFGIFYEVQAEYEVRKQAYKDFRRLSKNWKEKGIVVDDIWPRSYAEVDEQLNAWLEGNGQPENYIWTIWGYHILPSIYNQVIIEDPFGKVENWLKKLSVFSPKLKESIIEKHASSLKYWRNDYHYLNKVHRKDNVFLASLTMRLVHDILQVLYAVNEFYYPGDGMNLKYTEEFTIKPEHFNERISEVVRLIGNEDDCEQQYNKLMELIDDVLDLI